MLINGGADKETKDKVHILVVCFTHYDNISVQYFRNYQFETFTFVRAHSALFSDLNEIKKYNIDFNFHLNILNFHVSIFWLTFTVNADHDGQHVTILDSYSNCTAILTRNKMLF